MSLLTDGHEMAIGNGKCRAILDSGQLLLRSLIVAGVLLQAVTVAHSARAETLRCKIVAHRGASSQRPENTIAALERAIQLKAAAVEIDVRTSKDGVLFLLHDPQLERTTNGKGIAADQTIAELKRLDAGAWFAAKYAGQQIPTLDEALRCCRGRIDVLLDLKETGKEYAASVAAAVKNSGTPDRTIFGVHSPEQARIFRDLLPNVRQLGFIGAPNQIDAFVKADVDIIRIWPKWLVDLELREKLKKRDYQLQLNGKLGTPQELLPLLEYQPQWLLVDDVVASRMTLEKYGEHAEQFQQLQRIVGPVDTGLAFPWLSGVGEVSFLNRDYTMQELPEPLQGLARYIFDGGNGDRVFLRFHKPAVVFAVFEYNDTGSWSFPGGHSPTDYGWRRLDNAVYRGTSNGKKDGKPHYAPIYYGQFDTGQQLRNLPAWWLCLGIVDLDTARQIPGFREGVARPHNTTMAFSYEAWAAHERPLAAPDFKDERQFFQWQQQRRKLFLEKLVFRYNQPLSVSAVGTPHEHEQFTQQEFHVKADKKLLFRFFRLRPKATSSAPLPTIVCFMGHGKVRQILEERESYQHACAARFAEEGYLVYAMENVGMEPQRDTHLELDHLLRLDGYGWYSLLFAHQRILLEYVFADPQVDPQRVGAAGVSTGGLLALTAAAIDPRIAATSVQGIFGSMRVSFVQDRKRHCRCGAIVGLLPLFDLPELALLVLPRRLHISNATQDGFSPQESQRCIQRIAPWFQKANAIPPQFTMPPGGHEFAMQAALDFFRATLQGEPRETSEPR